MHKCHIDWNPTDFEYTAVFSFKGIWVMNILTLKTLARDALIIWLGGSDSKESACNARDPGSIPGWGRSSREGTGYPVFLPREFYG